MRAVVQRVRYGSVAIGDQVVSEINHGLVVLLGVGPGDNQQIADAMARKISLLRIFSDDQQKMNLSVIDVGGSVIVVSQFTLYADTRKGNRPSFIYAAAPDAASPLIDYFIGSMVKNGVPTQSGEFGAHMLVRIENDGPVTIWLEM